jgi:hypothetical protein
VETHPRAAALLVLQQDQGAYTADQCCGSGIWSLFDPRIRDPGWVLSPDPGSGMNNPDHMSESLETIFWVKILKFFDADPGSGMEKIQIRDLG